MSVINPLARLRLGPACALVLGSALALGAAAPAQAQVSGWRGYRVYEVPPPYYDAPAYPPAYIPEAPRRHVPPRRARFDYRAMLQDEGYRLLGPMRVHDDVVIADVVDPRGRSARLILDAMDGSILERFDGAGPRRAPRPPRDVATTYAPPRRLDGAGAAWDDGSGEPTVVPGVGPQSHAAKPKPRPKVATHTPAQEALKPSHPAPEKKSLPSETMKPPAPPTAIEAAKPPPRRPASRAPEAAKAAVAKPEETLKEPDGRSVRVIPIDGSNAQAPAKTAPSKSTEAAQDAPAKPVEATAAQHAEKPGYANGVPINPLD